MLVDPIETCPYNPVHRVRKSCMPYHLRKCLQNPDNQKKLLTCPFDARHHVHPLEFQCHIANCPARESVIQYKLINYDDHAYNNILPIETESIACSDENWDAEPEVKSYNPEKIIQNRAIVRQSIGLTKSKKREFKYNERRRIQQLEANNESQAKITAQVPEADDNNNEYKPLRRPKKLSDTLNSSALSLNNSIGPAAGERSTQQKKPMHENQAKANTSEELNVINEREEKIPGKVPKENANGNEHKPLRRPKTLSNDTLNMTALSLNCSVSSIASEKSTLQNKPTSANAGALWALPKYTQKANTSAPSSYAAALSRNASKKSDNFNPIAENERYEYNKENTINNSSFWGHNSLSKKMSKTVEEIIKDDAAHEKKTELLNQQMEELSIFKKNSKAGKKIVKSASNFPASK